VPRTKNECMGESVRAALIVRVVCMSELGILLSAHAWTPSVS
jgi:hypothetical protein